MSYVGRYSGFTFCSAVAAKLHAVVEREVLIYVTETNIYPQGRVEPSERRRPSKTAVM
jgi:hypothetical protein